MSRPRTARRANPERAPLPQLRSGRDKMTTPESYQPGTGRRDRIDHTNRQPLDAGDSDDLGGPELRALRRLRCPRLRYFRLRPTAPERCPYRKLNPVGEQRRI